MDDLKTPFHEGELAVQDKMGVRAQVHSYAPRFVRSFLPEQHRQLLETLPFIVVGSIDATEQPSASLLFGLPGFIEARDETVIDFNARPTYGDPLADNLRAGAPLGFLAIEFETRRRNRMNGKVRGASEDGFSVKLDQTFGNCPQYIQARSVSYEHHDPTQTPARTVIETVADDALQARLESADTFFIASSHFADETDEKHGVDVSHRGGKPGFVRYKDGVITFPDFTGNNHFNTIGNIMVNPKVGLVFPDFETGDMLYIQGEADVVWDGPEVSAFEGALRLITIRVTATRLVETAMPSNWRFHDYSPSLELTGTFRETASDEDAGLWRTLRVDRVERESSVINSFYLTPTDGLATERYMAGQHLPVRVPGKPKAIRTYTLSKAPCGQQYRLSIKREEQGAVSRFFHDTLRVGDTIEAMLPRGVFHIPEKIERPLVLVSAGVGITPMIAMLEEAVNRHGCAKGKKCDQPVVFIHTARSGEEHAFRDHPILRAPEDFGVTVFYAYSEPMPQDIIDKRFHLRGRLNTEALRGLLPAADADVFLCGPAGFMDAMRGYFTGLGVPDEQVQQEAFGPAPDATAEAAPDIDIPVTLEASGKEFVWNPAKGSLLDTAEAEGVDAPFSCRTGSCGTCLTKVLKGRVNHPTSAQYRPVDNEALICCALPADDTGAEGLTLDL